MRLRNFAPLCVLLLSFAGASFAQSDSSAIVIPLTVDRGSPLQVILTEKLRFNENEPVHGKVVEAVYAFDREVIPSGTEVLGRITGFQKPGKLKRFFRMLGGDFTPVRDPQITFDTLVLANGVRMPIETSVINDTEKVARFNGEKNSHGKDFGKTLVSVAKGPGNGGVKDFLWGLAPYHPQGLAGGIHLRAILTEPLDFGTAEFEAGVLDDIGSQSPSADIIPARLMTSLNSRTSQPGTPVEALLTRPIFSSNHRLIFPVGSTLRGEVLDASGARKFHRNGELAFALTTIEPPAALRPGVLPQPIAGHLAGVTVPGISRLTIDEEGVTRISNSKKRFIAPAYAFVKAGLTINNTADSFDQAFVGAYRSKVTKGFTGKSSGLGIPGSIAGAMVPPVGIGLGFFGAARSVYSNILGRGQDISLPSDTLIEVRLD